MNIGQNIKKERVKRNLTQAELGKLTGTSNTAISAYETNSSLPPIDFLVRIADIFGITLDELVGRNVSTKDTSKTYIPVIKTLSKSNIFEKDNIAFEIPLSKTIIKHKSFIYQAKDDLFYNCRIGRGNFMVIATDVNITGNDTVVYSVKANEFCVGIINITAGIAVISDLDGKAKIFTDKNHLKIKGVVTHIIKRLK